MTSPLLERATERVTLDGHDGRSGAHLERIRLDDGTSLILKTATPGTDITVEISGGVAREQRLWTSGALDRLTPPVSHAIIDVWDDGDATCTLMRDLGDAVPGWSRILSTDECGRILDAMVGLHATFLGDLPADLCTLELRVAALSPRTMRRYVGGHGLAEVIVRGWERFAEVTPPDLLPAVRALHDDPSPLVAAMREGPTTLVHADLWPVNLALEHDRVVLLDWAIATDGPPALDLAVFLTGSAAHVEPSREELIDGFRARSPVTDDRAMRLALLFGLLDLGWNKALDATEHEDPAIRDRELADLRWWQERARDALDAEGF
ncbi:MAG: phosphotransferase [Acidimicrobiales bacterium]